MHDIVKKPIGNALAVSVQTRGGHVDSNRYDLTSGICHHKNIVRLFAMLSKPTYEELDHRLQELDEEILALKRTQDGIRALEIAYRNIFETSQDGIAFVSLDGRIEDANNAYCRMLGYNLDELINLTYQNLTPKKWHAWEQEEVVEKQILKAGCSREYEKEYIRRDGTVFPVSVRAWLIKDEQDAPSGILTLVRDISERKWPEPGLHESERRFRELFDNMNSAVAIYKAKGNGMDFLVCDFNKACKQISNVKKNDILGRSVLEVFPYVKEFGLFEIIRHVWKTGIPQSHPISLYQGNRIIHFENYVYRLPSGEIVAVYKDITECRQTEEKLLETRTEMERQAKKRAADLELTNSRLMEEVEARKLAVRRTERLDLLMEELLLSPALDDKLKSICQGAVDLFRADLCRIWLIRKGDVCDSGCPHEEATATPLTCRHRQRCLHLMAGSGRYRAVDGERRRLPLDGYKIGEVASGKGSSFITDDTVNDPQIHDREWAEKLGLSSFAYCRLFAPDGSPQGVLELFAKQPFSADQQTLLKGLANMASQVVRTAISEEALKSSEKAYRDIFNSIIDGLAIVDLRGKIVDINPALCRICGYSRAEMIGLELAGLVHPAQRHTYENLTRQTREAGKFQGQTLGIRKDGTTLDVEARGIMIHLGNKPHILVIIRDISERKQMEAELLRSEKLESIGTLAGGMAHDYNNLLSVILGNISLAKMDLKPEDDVWQLLDEAERASNRAKDLTYQLITFSKGGTPIVKTAPIGEFIKKFSNLIMAGSNVACVCHMPEDLWPVRYDEGQMKQVINNILTNAKEAMTEGGTITILADNTDMKTESEELGQLLPRGKYVKISIQDQGVGIPEHHLTEIFDPYFSTKGLGTKKGTGLGLSTAYSIIKKHGGTITVESESGAGSTFHIWLPPAEKSARVKDMVKEKAKAAKPKVLLMDDEEMIRTTAQRILGRLGFEAYSREVANSETKVTKGKVLLMDDEEMIRTTAQRLLDRLGFEAKLARDGSEALKFYLEASEAGKPFDVVILDLTVKGGGMGGKEAAQRLQEIDAGAKVIISSGYSDDPTMVDFGTFGFAEAITKPYELQKLGNVLKKVMTRYQH